MKGSVIETGDLRLVPYRPVDLLALIRGVVEFRDSFGVSAADGLREFLLGPEVAPDYIDMLRSSVEADVWRHGFAVVDRKSELVVGNAAYVGPPDKQGEVEIAYATAPAFERRGFATQSANALTEYAFADARVTKVVAHTLPERNASTRILEKLGFTFAGQVDHPADGIIWRWEKSRSGPANQSIDPS